MFEPTATTLEKDKSGYIVSSIGKTAGEIPYTSFFTTKSYIEKHPDIVQKFTNALYKGLLWTEKNDSKKIAEAIKSYFPGMDVDTLSKVVTRYAEQDTWQKNLLLSEDALSNLENIIQSYQPSLIPNRPPYKNIVNMKFAEDAVDKIK